MWISVSRRYGATTTDFGRESSASFVAANRGHFGAKRPPYDWLLNWTLSDFRCRQSKPLQGDVVALWLTSERYPLRLSLPSIEATSRRVSTTTNNMLNCSLEAKPALSAVSTEGAAIRWRCSLIDVCYDGRSTGSNIRLSSHESGQGGGRCDSLGGLGL